MVGLLGGWVGVQEWWEFRWQGSKGWWGLRVVEVKGVVGV